MAEMTEIQEFILQLATQQIEASKLRAELLAVYPNLSEGVYLSAVLGLQNARLLVAEEDSGKWVYTTVQPEHIEEPEYSAEFAEKIIAADCGKWTAVDPDTLIAELDEMLKRAKERGGRKR